MNVNPVAVPVLRRMFWQFGTDFPKGRNCSLKLYMAFDLNRLYGCCDFYADKTYSNRTPDIFFQSWIDRNAP